MNAKIRRSDLGQPPGWVFLPVHVLPTGGYVTAWVKLPKDGQPISLIATTPARTKDPHA